MNTAVIWLRQDLRLSDHRALTAAVRDGYQVVFVYILDDSTPKHWRPGGASRWWLHHALKDMQTQVKTRGGKLILRRGKYTETLPEIVDELDAHALYFSRNYEPFMQRIERRIKKDLEQNNVEVKRFAGNILFDPDRLRTKSGTPFKVFTPFWKNCQQQPSPPVPVPVPQTLKISGKRVATEKLNDWQLLPKNPDWSEGLQDMWTPTEDAAHESLQEFLESDVDRYRIRRDIPSQKGTSRLSPYLHFGQISPAQIWYETHQHLSVHADKTQGSDTFLSEIGWREFSYHLLNQFPDLPSKPFRAAFEKFPWKKNAAHLRAWQQGQTGFPIVDAGMRELWHTGWMHNRVRMITASLLVKDLLIPWQQGAAWFWDTLVDADLASNSASWQWVAGCGADAAPYFRIFNPSLQGAKFDPAGTYVRTWVPELAAMPDKWIHEPASAPAEVLEQAGITLGKDYPKPVVDRKSARQRALQAYQQTK